MQRIEPSFSPSTGERHLEEIEGTVTNKTMRFLLYGFMLIFSGATTFFAVVLILREWKPYYLGSDLFICVGLLVVLTVAVYYTHSGRKMLYGVFILLPIMKMVDKNKDLAAILFGDHLFATFFTAALLYSMLIMFIVAIQRLRDCFIVIVRLNRDGVFLGHVSKDIIPWNAIDRVEEYAQYGKPAFRLHLKNDYRLNEKLLWSFYDGEPTIASKTVDINSMVLRDILSSHGGAWPSTC